MYECNTEWGSEKGDESKTYLGLVPAYAVRSVYTQYGKDTGVAESSGTQSLSTQFELMKQMALKNTTVIQLSSIVKNS